MIFRRIVAYLGLAEMPSERLWLQSMTTSAIRKSLNAMRSEELYYYIIVYYST